MTDESDTVFQSINPATGEKISSFPLHSDSFLQDKLSEATVAQKVWSKTSFETRSKTFHRLATLLRQQKGDFAELITTEMGKPIQQAEGEIEKCAWLCDYFAENAESFLSNEERSSDASLSYVRFLPLGVLLSIMPWNYPFWQVLRFAVPALMAGNTALLKHAPNVTRCALAIERLLEECDIEPGCFRAILATHEQIPALIQDPRMRGVTITGSVRAGKAVASEAGNSIKKTVLELGGSDPFIVLDDAPLEEAVRMAVRARFQNTGQSCIAAKRLLISSNIFSDFQDLFVEEVKKLKVQDPMDHSTDIGPLARQDLRETVHEQVEASLSRGAQALVGGAPVEGTGFYYQPTVLVNVTEEMTVCREEVFGPVATLIKVESEDQAVEIANRTRFGLGSTIWTSDPEHAVRLSGEIEAGQVFINGMVASDPRLPFGGVKESGYGRELSREGIREFVNLQTVWIGATD